MLPLAGRPGFFDERGEEYYRRTRQAKFGKSFEQIAEEGVRTWGNVREKWSAFGKLLDLNGSGPFVMGEQISYADLMLGAAFCWIRICEGGDMKIWKEMSEWQSGRWGKLWERIEPVVRNSSEVSQQ
jgi:glutathione S-transferase